MENKSYVENIKSSYLSLREQIQGLLQEIRSDFPNLTVHDIDHVDSLWRIASLIVGKNYPITPMEGYVLGCAFLIHDAVLSYKAFGGKDKLRETAEWKDLYQPFANTSNDTEEKRQSIDFKVLRMLHAKECKDLLSKQFGNDGKTYYLLENNELRTHYAEIIGKIASSHHWDIEEVRKLPEQVNPLASFPDSWTINPKKLACIIRCADSADIDSGRAPDYLFRLTKLNGVSLNHWTAQNRLGVNISKNDPTKLLITSTNDFAEEDFAAWNVAYDAVKVIEKELEQSNELLAGNEKFKVNGVEGSQSRKALSKYIRTNGWTPYNADVHIGDVSKLISMLGGAALYGKDDPILIVVRELVQNARDAIQARKKLEKDDSFRGRIDLRVYHDEKGCHLVVTDNGIGMSLGTVTKSLLDFGKSFWGSEDAVKEFPGLSSSGFRPVGQYGIGFFSVFMVAKSVVIDTRTYKDGCDKANLVKFPNGLTLMPIVSNHTSSSPSYSTSVDVLINEDLCPMKDEIAVKRNLMHTVGFNVPFVAALKALLIGLDEEVFFQNENGQKELIHHSIDDPKLNKKQWLKDLSFADYQNNTNLDSYINDNYKRLKRIENEHGCFAGFAALGTRLSTGQDFLGASTIGGLVTEIHNREGDEWIGILEKKPDSAKRTEGKFIASQETLKQWANAQVKTLTKSSKLDANAIYRMQLNMQLFNIDPINIAIVSCVQGWDRSGFVGDLSSLLDVMKTGKRLLFVDSSSLSSTKDEGHGSTFFSFEEAERKLGPDDILYHPVINSAFLSYKLVGGVPSRDYGFVDCLYRMAKRKKLTLSFEYIDDFIQTLLNNKERALVIKVSER